VAEFESISLAQFGLVPMLSVWQTSNGMGRPKEQGLIPLPGLLRGIPAGTCLTVCYTVKKIEC
jgi:hypothetical protein